MGIKALKSSSSRNASIICGLACHAKFKNAVEVFLDASVLKSNGLWGLGVV